MRAAVRVTDGSVMRRFCFLLPGFCLATLLAGAAYAAASSDTNPPLLSTASKSDQINIAGRQRMLTQRIVKSYVQFTLGVDRPAARQQIADSATVFQAQLSSLRNNSNSQNVADALGIVEALWAEFSILIREEPASEHIDDVVQQSERLLEASESLVAALVEVSGIVISELIDVAGRQRMLSQRFAKLYMLLAANYAASTTQSELSQTRQAFQQALSRLRESSQNTSTTRGMLDQMAAQWVWLEGSTQIQSDRYYPWIVASTSEKILATAEELTAAYTAIAGSLPQR